MARGRPLVAALSAAGVFVAVAVLGDRRLGAARRRGHRHPALPDVRRAGRRRARPVPRLPVRVPTAARSRRSSSRRSSRTRSRPIAPPSSPSSRSSARSRCSPSTGRFEATAGADATGGSSSRSSPSCPLLLGGVILTRFDLVPATLVAAAVALMARDASRAGSARARRRDRREALSGSPRAAASPSPRGGGPVGARRSSSVALAAAPVLLVYLPFLVLGAGRGRRLVRPAAGPPAADREPRCGRPARPAPRVRDVARVVVGKRLAEPHRERGRTLVAVLQGVAQVAALALVWVGFARGPATPERLLRYSAAALVAFVALSKVLVPAVPRLAGAARPARRRRRSRAALWLTVIACALTAIWFPALYWELVREFDPLASWLVLFRGVALVALLAVLIRPRNAHRLDRARPPRRRVARDERALEAHAARRRLEPHRHAGAHPPDRELAPRRRSPSRAGPSSRRP